MRRIPYTTRNVSVGISLRGQDWLVYCSCYGGRTPASRLEPADEEFRLEEDPAIEGDLDRYESDRFLDWRELTLEERFKIEDALAAAFFDKED